MLSKVTRPERLIAEQNLIRILQTEGIDAKVGLDREIAGAILLLIGIILFFIGGFWATIPIRDDFGAEQLNEIENYLFWSAVTKLAGVVFIILGIVVAIVGSYLIWRNNHNKNNQPATSQKLEVQYNSEQLIIHQ